MHDAIREQHGGIIMNNEKLPKEMIIAQADVKQQCVWWGLIFLTEKSKQEQDVQFDQRADRGLVKYLFSDPVCSLQKC